MHGHELSFRYLLGLLLKARRRHTALLQQVRTVHALGFVRGGGGGGGGRPSS